MYIYVCDQWKSSCAKALLNLLSSSSSYFFLFLMASLSTYCVSFIFFSSSLLSSFSLASLSLNYFFRISSLIFLSLEFYDSFILFYLSFCNSLISSLNSALVAWAALRPPAALSAPELEPAAAPVPRHAPPRARARWRTPRDSARAQSDRHRN